MKLGELGTNEHLGRRDAFHAPAILAQAAPNCWIEPGQRVWFVDENMTLVDDMGEGPAHGVIDPFLSREQVREANPFSDTEYKQRPFWVLLLPGTTSNLTHHFDISLPKLGDEDKDRLEAELAQHQKEDPGCAECYHIRDGEIIRD